MSRVDCDVHPLTPSIEQLAPHLDEYWRSYVAECGFRQPAGIAASYPPNAPTSGLPGGGAPLGELLAHLDGSGADRAILNCVYGLEGLRNVDFASALASAVNDWLAADWLAADARLRASIVVKAEDAEGAVREIGRRARDPRFVQVLLPARSERPYGNRSYFPVLAAAAEAGLPVAIHFGGCTGLPPTPVGWPTHYVEEHVGMMYAFEAQLTSLVAEGAFERLPQLRIVLAESGFTWLPSLMWRLDKEWRGLRREIPWVSTRPSESIRRHLRVTVQPIDGPGHSAALLRVLDQIGADQMLLFSSDFPHRHSAGFEQAFGGALGTEREHAILHANAQALYRL